MAKDRNITRLTPADIDFVREKCAKLPEHDWLVRLLATYDYQNMDAEALRRLLREDRAELRRLEAAVR